MNFVLTSPQFPKTYWKFAAGLKKNGFNVLGIGDAPYAFISEELKGILSEYYYCPGMNDYRELFKAVAFLSFKHGKIDWIESNNEYWLEKDAQIRVDFNITTGIHTKDIRAYKAKEDMKPFYHQAGVPTARYHIVDSLENAKAFTTKVGYPVFVKPNIGVGSNFSYKIKDEDGLLKFFATKDNSQYIMEEFIEGTIVSFDGVANSKSEVVFCASHVFPIPNADIVNNLDEDFYYTLPQVPEDLEKVGRATIKAFKVKQRFFHLEFFRLSVDKEGLGKKGDIVALEVNMRPAGGYTPEMINYACTVNCYQIWADVMAFDENRQDLSLEKFFCAEAARRDGHQYLHSHEEVMLKYKDSIVMADRYPPVINIGMGDQFYIAKFKTLEEVEAFREFILTRKSVIVEPIKIAVI
ncbi:MAG: ATP-grasp domain-containing protein [Firmicutes bacterium]|nr:ATP-grasp domain-containing protein [Bacillota bacterium]